MSVAVILLLAAVFVMPAAADDTCTHTIALNKAYFDTYGYTLGDGSYYLAEDVKLGRYETLVISGKVNLCLNGNILQGNGGQVIKVNSDAILNLYDCNTEKTHSFTDNGNYWSLKEGGEESISGGVITGGYDAQGAGVYNSGTFTMFGGNIIGNRAISFSAMGAGVYNSGIFTMDGGVISHNYVYRLGGGVYTSNKMTISDSAAIHDNVAGSPDYEVTSYGGGITVYGGSLTINGGNIYSNTATGLGGGIYIYSGCTVSMNDGTITGNDAISGYTLGTGGGIYNAGTLTMSGGTITGNDAASLGGGVYSRGSEIIVSGAPLIYGNTKEGSTPNNFYLPNGKTITIKGELQDAFIGVTTSSNPDADNPKDIAKGGKMGDEIKFFADAVTKYSIVFGDPDDADDNTIRMTATTPNSDDIRYTTSWYNETTLLHTNIAKKGEPISYNGETPKKAGKDGESYKFFGWSENPKDTTVIKLDGLTQAEGNTVYYAIFKEMFSIETPTAENVKKVTVKVTSGDTATTFDDNTKVTAASGDEVSVVAEAGEGYEVTEIVITKTRDGAEFETISNGETFSMPAYGVTITPKVERLIYTILFNATGGTVTPEFGLTKADGTLSITLPTPERDGYNFLGWFTEEEEGGEEVIADTVYTESTMIYAHWEKEAEPEPEPDKDEDKDEEKPEDMTPDDTTPDKETPDEPSSDDTPKGTSIWLTETPTPTPTPSETPTETPTQTETPTEPSGDDDNDGSIPPAAFIGGGLAVLIIAGLLSFAVFRRR